MRQKSNGTHLILMELMMVLFFFAICGSILLQVFVKAHNISAKSKRNDRDKKLCNTSCRTDRSGCL